MTTGVGWDLVRINYHPFDKHVPEHSWHVRPHPAKGQRRTPFRAVFKSRTNIYSITAEIHNRFSQAVLSFHCFCLLIFSLDPTPTQYSRAPAVFRERLLDGGLEDTGLSPGSLSLTCDLEHVVSALHFPIYKTEYT